jgi:uncharacterized membrane protein YeaQ/YmgE (transglycosylase-associated protein family)
VHLSDQGLLVILVVGVIAGWLAGKIVKGHGLGLVDDAAIGIVGRSSVSGSCIALDFISALESLASSSTPQLQRSCCSWLCGF